ncbi:MAG: putative Flp pilus-assembly TadE/G-like [Gaiellaceae bacterium]|nr:putative Flp pilus-assembly TadE/G-like [Gaiellaceae bacterium]
MRKLISRLGLGREEGQVLPMFAAGLVAMLMMTGIVIDGGNLFQNKQSVQNAADAAALAAAMGISSGGTCGACGTYAGMYAGYNGISGPNGDVTTQTAASLPACTGTFSPTNPPTAVPGCYVYPYNGDPRRVEVWLTRKTSNFFGDLLGIGTSTESARAVALATPSGPSNGPGIYIYSSGDVILKGGPPVQEPVIAQRNLAIQGTASVDSIARLVAVGLSGTGTVTRTGGGTLGDGPLTSLAADLPLGWTNSMSVGSTLGFQTPGTVFVAPPSASCTVTQPAPPCEWIRYGKPQNNNATLQNLTRGYGGFNALPDTAHSKGPPPDSVDPRVAEFWAPLGCGAFCNAGWFFANTRHTGVYAFTPPTFDLYTAFADAALGPGKPCDVGSVPAGFFGAGSNPQNPGNTTTGLTPNGATGYICKALDGAGNVIGEIAWGGSAGTTLGAETVPAKELKVIGTVFLNADLTVANNAVYQVSSAGASIWTTGGLNLTNTLLANCGTALAPVACGVNNWDPTRGLLGIVAHKVNNASNNDIKFSGGASFQGAMYSDGAIDLTGTGTFQGILDGAVVTVNGTAISPSPTIRDLPLDFPGSGGGPVTLVE